MKNRVRVRRYQANQMLVLVGCAWCAASASAAAPLASDGLPGVYRVGFATPMAPAFASGALTAGYGFTESQGTGDSAHHRELARLALGVSPADWFEAGVRLDERYDLHPDDGQGRDDGWVFDPRLSVRLALPASDSFFIGPELTAWVPGSESAST
ncbi:MAG TPA: hypothetical protein VGP93_00470, partial [Polyangiaceae bacterium]|nr:hypothetical protein [Polyangiaceae bacterium]